MNKAGSARDVILIIVVVFVMGIAAFIMNYMGNTAITQMVNTPAINESTEAVTALNSATDVNNRFDYIVFGCFIGFVLAMMITGWLVGGHPIFMFIYFIFVIIAVVVAVVLSNTWEMVSTSSVFGTTIANFTITNHLLTNMPIYAAVIGILGLIVMFAKPFIAGEG